jgi:small subunit ribosomal protein S27Ae
MMKREVFKIEGNKIVRQRKNCPKCGDGVFLADHKNRLSCGKCGYTEFKAKGQEEVKPKV